MGHDLIDIAKSFMQSNDVSHDIAHVNRVVLNARKIHQSGKYPSVEWRLLEAIVTLHDCVDKKYVAKEDYSRLRESLKKRIAEFFTQEESEFIVYVIERISYSTEKATKDEGVTEDMKPYLYIARDADRLDAIGAIGIARCFAFSAAKNRPLLTESIEIEQIVCRMILELNEEQSTSTNNESAIVHFYEKLIHLKDLMRTEEGKVMAQSRHLFIIEYIRQLYSEIA
jgi:uncharacterized protein